MGTGYMQPWGEVMLGHAVHKGMVAYSGHHSDGGELRELRLRALGVVSGLPTAGETSRWESRAHAPTPVETYLLSVSVESLIYTLRLRPLCGIDDYLTALG